MFKPILAGTLIASLAFAGGFCVGKREVPGQIVEGTANTRTRSASARGPSGTRDSDDAGRKRAPSVDAFLVSAKSTIRIGPQAERLRRFLTVLDGLDAGNWEELLHVMANETSENGRFQPQEWDMALRRVGMMDGARAAELYAAKGEDETLRKVLAG